MRSKLLADALIHSKNHFGLSLLVIFAWIASADGVISSEEESTLRSIGKRGNHAKEVDIAISVGKAGRGGDLQLACEVVRLLPPDKRKLFVQMAIGVALEDGVLATPENYILRFLADLVGLGVAELDDAFREMTGKGIPEPGDSSAPEWWAAHEGRGPRREGRSNHEKRTEEQSSSGSGVDMERLRNLAILGLDETATQEEIQFAYRRMAQVHHPDRYATLGPEAVKAAERTFKRIRNAYDNLRI